MNSDVEIQIRNNVPWSKLSPVIQHSLGNSEKEYEKCVLSFSIKNQLRFQTNLIRQLKKDEKKYYDEILDYSLRNLMLFPYHLSDIIIRKLHVNSFQYYISMMESLILQEKSYDYLPNFTAADCLRLLGIGRNQYIELMNQNRSSKKLLGFFGKKGCRSLLPTEPVSNLTILPWWIVQNGHRREETIKQMDKYERNLMDQIDETGAVLAGTLHYETVLSLYKKGLIYFDVPIYTNDCVSVPPLEGFVMNRILGDFLETLMYKIFVSIDENTTVLELSHVLGVDSLNVQDAVSVYCRLGFAKKKNNDMDVNDVHPSWYDYMDRSTRTLHDSRSLSSEEEDSLLRELNNALEKDENLSVLSNSDTFSDDKIEYLMQSPPKKKIGFLFDSSLTAYLMMGNLSPGLKNHAVTMFEVGKLSDESLESFLIELEKVSNIEGEGEAARYFSHALALRDTIVFLRNTSTLSEVSESLALDLIRCESLQSLDSSIAARVLNKNYSFLVSMAPLHHEIRPNTSLPPHLGPVIPEISSVWFKLFLYHSIGLGPPSLLLVKGTRISRLPPLLFDHCSRLLVTSWGHDPGEMLMSGSLLMISDALLHSSLLIQEYSSSEEESHIQTLPFPFLPEDENHEFILKKLESVLDMKHNCGYLTLLNSKGDDKDVENNWTLLNCHFGIPLFDGALNKSVCERIVSKRLIEMDSLNSSKKSNEELCEKLLAFIHEFGGVSAEEPGEKLSSELMLPTNNLIFNKGKLSIWNNC